MTNRSGLATGILGGAIAMFGVILGARSQRDQFLSGDLERDLASGGASGTIVVLTAMLVALGITLVAAAWTRLPARRAAGPLAAVAALTWFLTMWFQLDYPNYTALEELRTAEMVQSHLIHAGVGSPSTLVAVLAFAFGGLGAAAWAVDRLLGGRPTDRIDPLTRRHGTSVAVAIVFLIMAAVGQLAVLLSLPAGEPDLALTFVLLPLGALCALGLAGLMVARVRSLQEAMQEPRLQIVVRETWRTLDRLQWALVAAIAAIALLSAALPARDVAQTALGRTLVFTIRSHGQSMIMLLIPLIPVLVYERRIRNADWNGTRHSLGATSLIGASVVALVAAIVATAFVIDGLTPWIIAALPLVAWGATQDRSGRSAPMIAWFGWLLWARADTVQAVYNGNVFPPLEHAVPPGVLALGRMVAAVVFAWAMQRICAGVGNAEPQRIRVPLALGTAVASALVLLLELPLAVWAVQSGGEDTVAVGSLVASQEPAVRALMHGAAVLLGAAAVLLASRLIRPDWFAKRPGGATPTPMESDKPPMPVVPS